jgi:photolyase PhrII
MHLSDALPEHLAERTRPLGDRPPEPAGAFVLYWMHNALRAHENPALDVALWLSGRLGLPLLVYQGLSERYDYASDRHHAFILQGARDAHAGLAGRGIAAAFHLERPGSRGPHLRTLARRAAVVVTEDLPTQPITGWLGRLAAGCAAPLYAVDTACVVPMRLVGKAHDRAFAFRDATRGLLEKRLTRAWPEVENPARPYFPTDLPFVPVDLATADLAELIRACEIDHAVGPVGHTVGGSAAGYARWEAFKERKLRRYADDRNDALRDGVSRMSPYLHYGMVSPMRIAREAAGVGGPGAEKYLDELLVWRELAYAFCFYRKDHESTAALPAWAVRTLAGRAADPRPALFDWETLARGKTGDPLWDAAQRSYLMRGELHNNVRMTWGKAFLHWTPDAETALRRMIDLNHRYALDGRDPASYGGLLWCLGQFDRPFPPPRPILGTVRPRPTEEHAARLDPEKYLAKVTRPARLPAPRVAVVGAGLSGLIAARTLQDHGLAAAVFEKSDGPGGRAATRRAEAGLTFDHGAQYFTARDPHFSRYVAAWAEQGVVAEWAGRIVEVEGSAARPKADQPRRYVGVPGMSAVARHLAADVPVRFDTKIVRLARAAGGWELGDAAGQTHGPFDYLVVALPSPQAAWLLGDNAFAAEAKAVPMTPCWAVMAAFGRRVEAPWDGAFVHGSPLAWAARNSSKPGRPAAPDCWVLHAGPDWSAAHLDLAPDAVAAALLAEFGTVTAAPAPPTVYLEARRWLFSATASSVPCSTQGTTSLDRMALFDRAGGLAVCGDWLAGGRVEGAFRSGVAAAGCLLREVGIPPFRGGTSDP